MIGGRIMKKSVVQFILLTALLLISLCGCTDATLESTEPQGIENPYFAENCIPWKYDACAKAMEAGTMEYYFMHSDDVSYEKSDGSISHKWGDSCLIVFPNGETMLIDSGRPEYAYVLSENLRRLGITKIDYLLFSHSHIDHVGGATTVGGVLQSIEVGKVFYPDVDQDYDYKIRCKAASLEPEDYEPLIAGDTRTFGDVTMTVLWPTPSHQGKVYSSTDDANNTSLVVRLEYKDHSSLFTGDLYREFSKDKSLPKYGEEQMVKYYTQQGKLDLLDVDLLKVPHHGSSTSSGDMFLDAVTPTLSIATGYEQIGDAVRRRYGDCKLINDRECGYIHVTVDGTGALTYECSLYNIRGAI